VVVIGVLTLAVLVGQLVVFWRQAEIMKSQTELLKSQHELAQLQAEWRRDEALGTFYRLAHDLVAEFRKATVLPTVEIPADFGTHPRQMLREASRLFAPLGRELIFEANAAALRLDDYFTAVVAYNADPRGRDGAARWQTVQDMREQVGRDLDRANSHISPELRWRYGDGTDYDFRKLCSFPPGLLGEETP
jgi:hypothetical protein